ncbi:MAG: hypothetical protein FH756_01615 [Firmicutes bacterium]|nr:hypothetical protein [Bacillota bacterium]
MKNNRSIIKYSAVLYRYSSVKTQKDSLKCLMENDTDALRNGLIKDLRSLKNKFQDYDENELELLRASAKSMEVRAIPVIIAAFVTFILTFAGQAFFWGIKIDPIVGTVFFTVIFIAILIALTITVIKFQLELAFSKLIVEIINLRIDEINGKAD